MSIPALMFVQRELEDVVVEMDRMIATGDPSLSFCNERHQSATTIGGVHVRRLHSPSPPSLRRLSHSNVLLSLAIFLLFSLIRTPMFVFRPV